MRFKRTILYIINVTLLIILYSLASCDDDCPTPILTHSLFLNYYNSDGNSPVATIDKNKSSDEIIIDFDRRFKVESDNPPDLFLIFDNLRIVDAQSNYVIKDSIEVFENRNGVQIKDTEFNATYKKIENILVYLILDVSSSLGNDINKVKEFGFDFAQSILENNDRAKVGIIAFSTNIDTLLLTDDVNEIKGFISNLQQGTDTRLNQAMHSGIQLLQSEIADSKIIVTFTDGFDNFSPPGTLKITNHDIKTALTEVDQNQIRVNSYLIRLRGQQAENIEFKDLVDNEKFVKNPNNINELKDVFNDFSKIISEVYNIRYRRNNSVIPESNKVEIEFRFKTDPKI